LPAFAQPTCPNSNDQFSSTDTPHEIAFPILVHNEGATATAEAHFPLPYIPWGLKNPRLSFWKAEKEGAIDRLFTDPLSK